MSDQFASDETFKPTQIRQSGIIGASFTGASTDSGWYRVLPDGVTATRPADNQLMLENLRADVEGINLQGWTVIVLNDGFVQQREIMKSEDGLITVKPKFRLTHESDGTELGTDDIRYILLPNLLKTLNITFDDDSAGSLEIGYSTRLLAPGLNGYSREMVTGDTGSPTIITIAELSAGTGVIIPAALVDNLFYRFTTASDDNKIYWGEQRVVSAMASGAIAGGAGGSVRVVATVPTTATAQANTLYVRLSDDTEWYLGERQVARVPASITDIDLVARADWTWLNELTDDPDNNAAAAYYNTEDGVFRRKPAGELVGSVTTGDFTLFATGTYIGAFATDPTLTEFTEEFYYNTTDHRFRFHTPIDTEWFNETFFRAFDGVFIRHNQAHTTAQVIAWLQINYIAGEDYAYYDQDDDVVYDVTAFTASVSWIDTTIDAVVGDAAAVFLGADVNSDDAVIAYYVANDYNSDLRSFFYNATEIREVTDYVAEVPAHTVPEVRQTAGGGGSGLNQSQVDARVREIAITEMEFTEVASQAELNAVDITNVVPFVKVTADIGSSFVSGDRLIRDSVSGEWAVFIAASDFGTNGGDSDSRGFITVPPADVSDGGHEVSLSVSSVDAYSHGLRLGYYVKVVATSDGLAVEVNSLGARGVVRKDLSSFEAGDLEIGQFIVIQYDSVNDRFVSDFQPGGAVGGNSLQPSYFWVFQRSPTEPTAEAGTYSSSGNSYTPAGDWQLEANTGNNPLWGMPVSISSGGNPSVGEVVRLTHNSLDQPNSFWIFREVAERPDTAPGFYSLSTGIYTLGSGWSLRFPIQNRTHPVWGQVITISATGSVGTTGNPIQLTQLFRNVTIDTVNDQSELDAVDTRNRVAYVRIATTFDTYQLNDIWVYIETDDEWQLLFRATGGGGSSLQGTSFWIFREQANTEPTVAAGTYVAATNVYTPPSGWQRLFPEDPDSPVWGAIVQISATSESIDVNDTPVQLTQHNSLQPSTFWIFRAVNTRPTTLASGSFDRTTGEFTPTTGWTVTFPTDSTTTIWGRVVRISANGNIGTAGSAVQFTNLLGAVTVTEVADQAALNAIDTDNRLAYAKVTALFGDWQINDLLVYTSSWELLFRLGAGSNSLQPSYFWVFQDSSDAPAADAGTYDSDANDYTPGGDWLLEAHGTPADILWGMPVAIASDGTPSVGVVVQLTQLNALQPSSFWIFRSSSTDPGIASGSYDRGTGIFTPSPNWSLTFPSTTAPIWGRAVRITPTGGVNTLGNSIQLTNLFGRVRITEVADQDELDAVSTVGEVAYAKVTGVFGSWQVNDILIYTDTWELLIRLGTGSNSLQPSYFWLFQRSVSEPNAGAGAYDTATNVYTPAGNWLFEPEAADPAVVTSPDVLWGLPVSIAADGTPTVSEVVRLTHHDIAYSKSFWIFRAGNTRPGSASGAYDRVAGRYNLPSNWSLRFPSNTSNRTIPIWGQVVEIDDSGSPSVVGNPLQLTNLGRVTVTDVDDQGELDAIATADRVTFARITTAFDTYQLSDLWTYIAEEDEWQLLFRPTVATVTKASVYAHTKEIIEAGDNTTVVDDDTAETVTIATDRYHFGVQRIYMGGTTPSSADHITINVESGDVYDLTITRHTGAEALPENFLNRLGVGVEIRVALLDNSVLWEGDIVEVHSIVGDRVDLRVNFGGRVGTFTNDDIVIVSFGYARADVHGFDYLTVRDADVTTNTDGDSDEIDLNVPEVLVYEEGIRLGFYIQESNAAANITLRVNSLAYLQVRKEDFTQFAVDEFLGGRFVVIQYNPIQNNWISDIPPASGAPTRTEVYDHTKEIIEAGDNAVVTEDDDDETITITADLYPISVERRYADVVQATLTDQINLAVESDDIYDLTISRDVGDEALPHDFLNRLEAGVPIRLVLSDGSLVADGKLVDVVSVVVNRVVLRISFDTTIGIAGLSDDDIVVVSFGHPRADTRSLDYMTIHDDDVSVNSDDGSNEIALTISQIGSEGEGLRFGFFIPETSTVDNVKIQLNDLPMLPALKSDSTEFLSGEWVSGRFVVVQFNGTAWITDIDPVGARPTRAEVYDEVKEIVEAGLNATVTEDDTDRTLTVAADNPSGVIFLDTDKVTHTATNTFLNLLPTIVPSAYYDGLSYRFTVKASNLGNDEGSLIIYVGDITTTLLSPYPVRYADGSAFARGEFPDGRTITVTFDLANNEWRSNVTPALTSTELRDSADAKQGTLSGEDLVATIQALSLGNVEYTEVADQTALADVDTARVAFVKITADFGTYVVDDFLVRNTVSDAWVVLFNISSNFNGVSFTEVDDQDELDAIVTDRRVAFAKVTTAFDTYELDDYLLYTGTSWDLFLRISSTVTRSAVYPRVRAILQAGDNVSLDANDTDEEIEISADNPSKIVYLNADDVTITSGFYTLVPDPIPSAYTQGLAYKFRLTVGSTSSGTIQVRVGEAGESDSLDLRPLRHVDGSNVQPGDLRTGQILTITYDAVNSRWLASTRPTISESQIESDTSDTPGVITGRRWKQAYDHHAKWAGGPPTWVYYGFNQTSRRGPERIITPQANQSTIYTFDSTLHEAYFGAGTTQVSFLTTDEASNVDTRDNTLGPANNAVFELISGVWNVQFNLRIVNLDQDFNLHADLYQVNSGSDDNLIDGVFPVVNNNSTTVLQLDYKYLDLSALTALYFLIVDINTAGHNTSGYMVLEKLE